MTATLTHHVTVQPNFGIVRRNRAIQWITSTGQVMTIPSVIKIRDRLRTKLGQYFSEIGEVLIISGSAPQTISIRGMMV